MKKKINPSIQELLCDAFSINFSCLRASAQDDIFENDNGNIFSSKDVFKKKSLKDYWHKEKMRGISSAREELFERFYDALKKTYEQIDISQNEAFAKEYLMKNFNHFFGTNKTFDECFSGYEILDQEFKHDFERFDNHAIIAENKLGLSNTINAYYAYLNTYHDHMIVQSFEDLINTLYSDFSSEGYKTLFYGKPQNPKVSKLTRGDIDELILSIFPAIAETETATDMQNKSLLAVQKQLKKDPYNRDLLRQQMQHVMNLKSLNIKNSKLKNLAEVIEMLDNRLKRANVDYDTSFSTTFTETFMDLISSTKQTQSPSVDWIYVHEHEKEFLSYLYNSLGMRNPLEKSAKINENSSQNPQKI